MCIPTRDTRLRDRGYVICRQRDVCFVTGDADERCDGAAAVNAGDCAAAGDSGHADYGSDSADSAATEEERDFKDKKVCRLIDAVNLSSLYCRSFIRECGRSGYEGVIQLDGEF